uniref:Serpentine receptor class gamma n=1 Tax=Haemonchus contortus TaxID=6289 RepID=A0A7I4YP23_HAECO
MSGSSTSIQQTTPATKDGADIMRHDVLHTVIEGILVTAYVFVLFIIITSKTRIFKTAFYVIFVATGIADVFAILISCFSRLNRQLRLGPEFKPVISVLMIFSGTTFLTHMIGNIFITINRYSALRFLKSYEKIWCRRNVWIMIFVQYIVAFAAFSNMIGVEIFYKQDSDGRYTLAGVEPSASWRYRYIYTGVSFAYALISVTFNVKLFLEWRRLSKISGHTRLSRHEKGLLLYTALVFVSTMLMCIQQILKAIATLTGNTDFDLWATMQFFWVNDVMVCVPPFCLMVLSTELRRDIANFFRCTRHQNKSTASVTVFTTRQPTRRK